MPRNIKNGPNPTSDPRVAAPVGKTRSLRVACALIVLGTLLYYAVQVVLRTPPIEPAQVIAHRGGAAGAPENTLAAFRQAMVAGADALELDVQMSKDGALVVIHDETVDRTTNGIGAIKDLTLDELQALDAGAGERIPTFDEVIAAAKYGGVRLIPEAKSPKLYPGIEQKMLQALEDAKYLDATVIQSFDATSLEKLRALSSEAQLCALHGTGDFGVGTPGGAQYVCPMAEMVLLYPAMIRDAHREGKGVYVWFLGRESPATLKVLRFFGADGFIVNDPAAARTSLAAQ